jgi:hypothetical protein
MEEVDFKNLIEVFQILKKWREESEAQTIANEESQSAAN